MKFHETEIRKLLKKMGADQNVVNAQVFFVSVACLYDNFSRLRLLEDLLFLGFASPIHLCCLKTATVVFFISG
jgi:hypothetical protein